MQQASFYHNTAFCFSVFLSAHNACKSVEKKKKGMIDDICERHININKEH